MAGTVIQIVVPVSIHHRWDMLEDHLVERSPAVSHLDTFGCECTQQALCDPIFFARVEALCVPRGTSHLD